MLHASNVIALIFPQFGSNMPKLLLVGIVEKTCLKTVIREIPGITDCFKSKDDKGGETVYRVCI